MRVFNITRFRVPALITSVSLILLFWGYSFLIGEGFNLGIDFQAGLVITVDIPTASDEEDLRMALTDFDPRVQTVGNEGERFNIRIADDETVQNFQQTTSSAVIRALNTQFDGAVTVVGEEYIQSSFAALLATQTVWVTLVALIFILLYVWIRFKLNYAVSAIIAVFHDVLFLLGFIGAFGLEFSTATIAAVLTIIGYSLNDTIVIFDRVRENSRIVKEGSFRDTINLSVSQSMSRTLITSITTLLAVSSILIFATATAIQTFALNLVVGIVVGTYSSIFVASPVLLAWHDRDAKRTQLALLRGSVTNLVKDSSSTAQSQSNAPEPVKQTADEIAEATARRAKAKVKKKKKKK